jgi:hypothetical protein
VDAWYSSGITTRVIGALKGGLTPLENEFGARACSGRGTFRQAPRELVRVCERVGFDGVTRAFWWPSIRFVRGALKLQQLQPPLGTEWTNG